MQGLDLIAEAVLREWKQKRKIKEILSKVQLYLYYFSQHMDLRINNGLAKMLGVGKKTIQQNRFTQN